MTVSIRMGYETSLYRFPSKKKKNRKIMEEKEKKRLVSEDRYRLIDVEPLGRGVRLYAIGFHEMLGTGCV